MGLFCMGVRTQFFTVILAPCADLLFYTHGFYFLFFLFLVLLFVRTTYLDLLFCLNSFVTFVRGCSPNLLGSPISFYRLFFRTMSILVIGLYDQ